MNTRRNILKGIGGIVAGLVGVKALAGVEAPVLPVTPLEAVGEPDFEPLTQRAGSLDRVDWENDRRVESMWSTERLDVGDWVVIDVCQSVTRDDLSVRKWRSDKDVMLGVALSSTSCPGVVDVQTHGVYDCEMNYYVPKARRHGAFTFGGSHAKA